MRARNRMIALSTGLVIAVSGATAVRDGDESLRKFGSDSTAVLAPSTATDRPVTNTIALGPATAIAGLDMQHDINNRDLEITNVHLGGVIETKPQATPATGRKLAQIATADRQGFLRPTASGRPVLVDGVFDLATPGTFGGTVRTAETVIVASNETASIKPTTDFSRTKALPRFSDVTLVAALLPVKSALPIAQRLAALDLNHHRPKSNASLDQSPFGMTCASKMQASVLPGALVQLELTTPCQPYAKVTISHGKLNFAQRTSHTGRLSVVVPVLEQSAEFSATFENGYALQTNATVPELQSIKRVAIVWEGAFDLDLHAFEFGAEHGSIGHVSILNPRSVPLSTAHGGGYIMQLGDSSLPGAKQAEVYSVPTQDRRDDGTVRLAVTAHATKDNCDQSASVINFRSSGGTLIASGGLRFKMPGCDQGPTEITLKNAVRDLNIALE